MKTEFRNRAFLPVVLPVAIFGFIALVAVGFAMILLYNTRESALVLASVAAAGVLIAIALASSQDELDGARAGVVVVSAALPVVLGLAAALGWLGEIDDSDRNINRQPHAAVPADAVVIGADSLLSFDHARIDVPADVEVTVLFDNRDVGISHNWALYADDSFTGGIVQIPQPPTPGLDQSWASFTVAPGEYVFICDVHPNMRGVLVASPGAEPAVSEPVA